MNRQEIFDKIAQEMDRQDEKWGPDRNQHPAVWLTVLSEEVGEVAKEICDSEFDIKKLTPNYEKELIQVAAVAISAVQGIRHYKKKS